MNTVKVNTTPAIVEKIQSLLETKGDDMGQMANAYLKLGTPSSPWTCRRRRRPRHWCRPWPCWRPT